jgi:caa(3)-type oxidase subunit IV
MAETHHHIATHHHDEAHHHDGAHHHPNYVKVWLILLGLLAVSIVGPMAEIRWLTLVTAFGIAVVKAYLVATNFMHINIEKRYVVYMVSTCLVFMLLFFAGVAPDVMKPSGTGWVKNEVDEAVLKAPVSDHH